MASVWDTVIGQDSTTSLLVHLTARSGSRLSLRRASRPTKEQAARAVAAVMISGSDDPDDRHASRHGRRVSRLPRGRTRLVLASASTKRSGFSNSHGSAPRKATLPCSSCMTSISLLMRLRRVIKTIEEPPASTSCHCRRVLADQSRHHCLSLCRLDFCDCR